MKNLFKFDDKQVRIFIINNEVLFAGVDVAKALGYERPDNAITNHCEDRKIYGASSLKSYTPASGVYKIPNKGLALIPESDVYALIFNSNLESAMRFKRWVFKEVLPSIRKTGSYSVAKSPDWSLERLVSKLGYKSMCDAIKASKENPATYDYSNNADLINRIILGMSAKQYRELNELGRKDAIRDKLEAHIIFAYSRLQFENERLIIEGVDFQDRKEKLKAHYAWLSQGLLPKTEKKPKLKLVVNNEEKS